MTEIETKILNVLGVSTGDYATAKAAIAPDELEAMARSFANELSELELDVCRELGIEDPADYARIAVVLPHVPTPTRGPVSLAELHSGVIR